VLCETKMETKVVPLKGRVVSGEAPAGYRAGVSTATCGDLVWFFWVVFFTEVILATPSCGF
jgi:hypothetical protein